MATIYNTPKSIIYDSIVFHIDPPNKHCIAEGDRTDPLTNGDVKDISGNLSTTIQINDSTDASGDTYKPQWQTSGSKIGDSMGYIKYTSNGAGSAKNTYSYGYLNLGAPVNGVTKFGETDCYTIDLWWRQDTTTDSQVYQGMHLLGHREVITEWPSYSSRKYVYGSYNINIYGSAGNNYYLRWRAGQINYETDDKKYYDTWAQYINTFDTWHHHCCVFDLGNSLGGGSKAYTYLNGVPAVGGGATATATTSGAANWVDNTVSGGNIYIGASNRQGSGALINDGRSNGADGGMGPFKIYNRALTADEVLQNYQALAWRYK